MKSERNPAERRAGNAWPGVIIAVLGFATIMTVVLLWVRIPHFGRPALPDSWTPECAQLSGSWVHPTSPASRELYGGLLADEASETLSWWGVGKPGPGLTQHYLSRFDLSGQPVTGNTNFMVTSNFVPLDGALWMLEMTGPPLAFTVTGYDPASLLPSRSSHSLAVMAGGTDPNAAVPLDSRWGSQDLVFMPTPDGRLAVLERGYDIGLSNPRANARTFIAHYTPADNSWTPFRELTPVIIQQGSLYPRDLAHIVTIESPDYFQTPNAQVEWREAFDLVRGMSCCAESMARQRRNLALMGIPRGRQNVLFGTGPVPGSSVWLDPIYTIPTLLTDVPDTPPTGWGARLAARLQRLRRRLWEKMRPGDAFWQLRRDAVALEGIALRFDDDAAPADRLLDPEFCTSVGASLAIAPWAPPGATTSHQLSGEVVSHGLNLWRINAGTSLLAQQLLRTPATINQGDGLIRIGTLDHASGTIEWLGWIPRATGDLLQQNLSLIPFKSRWILTTQIVDKRSGGMTPAWITLPALVPLSGAQLGVPYESWMGTPPLE
ncbi:MAG: hypothetical protein ABI743_03035 [bacterium]